MISRPLRFCSVVGDAAADARGELVQLGDAILRLVQLQAIAAAAETVGEDDISAGGDHGAVQVLDAVGMIDVPQFRRIAGGSPASNRLVPVAPSASR